MTPILYFSISILVFLTFSIYYKRTKHKAFWKADDDGFFNDIDHILVTFVFVSAIWPISIPLITAVVIAKQLIKVWRHWVGK